MQLTDEHPTFSSRSVQRAAPNDGDRNTAIDFVLSPEAQPLLETLAQEALDDRRLLTLLSRLRRAYPAAIAAELVTQVRLRRRAAEKFRDADRMFFIAEALEQATAQEPAEHRAAQMDEAAPPGVFLDLGCGIGGDLIALAKRRPVIAYEKDPLRARLAEANAAALGLAQRVTVVQADWTAALAKGELPQAAAAFVDPSRRSEGRRTFSLHTMQPSIGEILKLCDLIPLVAVKVTPGVQAAEIPANCCVEFVSHDGVCKEAVLWLGRPDAPKRWASVHRAEGWLQIADEGLPPPVGELAPGMVLYEPDGAVIRAGALGALCARLSGHLVAPDVAYIAAPHFVKEPLAQAFLIEEVHRFSLKVLNQRLVSLGIGQVELLKRGFPQAPESLRPRLRLAAGGRAGAVLFMRRGNEHWMAIGRRLSDRDEERSDD
ncbi:MAG: class I SAM-dependent methyltransferase [Caldilinea sp.]|jgi:SAM-dependent methyltransferase|uniref:class I SAM-dependent methyltransferase n=1 Tax=Caldilinea sp. TaxID=2293560 RepID=UPI0030B53EF4